MTRPRLVPAGLATVIAVALVFTLALASAKGERRDDGPAGCAAGAMSGFCLDLAALEIGRDRPASAVLGMLDQIPACSPTGALPSFCLELPATVASTPTRAPSTSGDPCAQLAPSDAPIFCLGAVAVGPSDRAGLLRYLSQQAGLNMHAVEARGALLQVDGLIGASDADRILTAVEGDVAAVESYLGRRFQTPPAIFVLALRSSYAKALEHLLRFPAATAAALATQTGGLYVGQSSVIFVNWENVRSSGPLLVMRHELTHDLVREQLGPTAMPPAWVDEGLATLVQDTVAPSDAPDRGAYVALALLARGRASLDALNSLDDWAARNAALGGNAYAVAKLAVRALLAKISLPALLEIFAAQQRGATFAAAYEQVVGSRYGDFVASFAREVAACGPGIAVGPPNREGNAVYVLHGFPADADVQVTIDGTDYHIGFVTRTDSYGSAAGTFGATARAGRYEIMATTVSQHASAAIVTDSTAVRPPSLGLCGNE